MKPWQSINIINGDNRLNEKSSVKETIEALFDIDEFKDIFPTLMLAFRQSEEGQKMVQKALSEGHKPESIREMLVACFFRAYCMHRIEEAKKAV